MRILNENYSQLKKEISNKRDSFVKYIQLDLKGGILMSLEELKPGQKAIIKDIKLDGRFKSRLMTMGLINGTEIEFKKRAPLGDPVQIKVRGYDLSFRNNDAKNIIVELC